MAEITSHLSTHLSSSSRRRTLGLLTANIHLGAARTLWLGVADAAAKHDQNLFCFPGGVLRVTEHHEAQRNVIYDLIDPAQLDGLITWASTLGGQLSPADVMDFHRRFRSLPVISLAQIIEGAPTLSIDSYHGMRAAIVHLIEVHGLRKLAFIRGPVNHFFAQERYRAYTDVLQEYGLPYVPELVTRPLQWDAGAEAVQILLDGANLRPGVDFQAIVSVSDLLLLEAMKALQLRGIQVPRDVAVVGFNDSLEGQLTTPPLTSVSMPFYEQGSRAVDAVIDRLANQPVPDQVVLHSRLIVRQSCGCPATAVVQAAANVASADAVAPQTLQPALRAELLSDLAGIENAAGTLTQQAGRLFDVFLADRTDRSDRGSEHQPRFLTELAGLLAEAARNGRDVAAWQDAISVLRRRLLPYLSQSERCEVEDLFNQARVLIGEAAQRTQAYRQFMAEQQSNILRDIGRALITTFNVDKLTDVLAEQLPQLGIHSCYLALYDNPAVSLDVAHLIMAYTEHGRVELEPGGRQFPAHQLVPPDLLPDRRYSYIVEPLFFREEQIGFVLFEAGPRDGSIYEVLRGHLSSALKGALLLAEAQQARVAAEKADEIKTRLLTNVSHELRTPLNIILDTTRHALTTADPAQQSDLHHIQHTAEHQLRVINDLLDLSRAEIDELDLYLELIDPRPLLVEAFHDLADQTDHPTVRWELQLPDRLPWLNADAVRLRQVLLNLLSNARKFTERGHITLGAEVAPPDGGALPHLHLWVADSGPGIAADQQDSIFEPFVSAGHARAGSGIGLGLSITRHLIALHGGSIALTSQLGRGSTFHIYLPLPRLSDQATRPTEPAQAVLLLIASGAQPPIEIAEFAQRQQLELRRLRSDDDIETVLADVQPIALAWDLVNANPSDWQIVRHLRNHPRLSQTPFILYGQLPQDKTGQTPLAVGLTSFVTKPAPSPTLLDAINASRPIGATGSILIVDDDPAACEQYRQLIAISLPGYSTRIAYDGAAALELLQTEVPSLVILDLMMPGLDGAEVLDRMRADLRWRQVPVVILSSKLLNLDDVKRLERHARVTLQSKGVLTDEETLAALNRALFGDEALPPHTGALVKRALAYLHQNYARPLSRWEIAEAVGVSEDYLSRVFNRELGLSPWDYLTRYRIQRAKELLQRTDGSIRAVAHQVGFKDQAYFSRVFRKQTGLSPQAFRDNK